MSDFAIIALYKSTINTDIDIVVYCACDSIQQLHYEMANNLMRAMEVKLNKTYIAEEST